MSAMSSQLKQPNHGPQPPSINFVSPHCSYLACLQGLNGAYLAFVQMKTIDNKEIASSFIETSPQLIEMELKKPLRVQRLLLTIANGLTQFVQDYPIFVQANMHGNNVDNINPPPPTYFSSKVEEVEANLAIVDKREAQVLAQVQAFQTEQETLEDGDASNSTDEDYNGVTTHDSPIVDQLEQVFYHYPI